MLRLFDATAEPAAIPAKRPWRRSGWFGDGELPRRVLDTLRAATPAPLNAGEIALRIMAEKGLEAGDGRALELIRKSVAAYLRNRNDGPVRRTATGNGRDVRWRIGVPAAERDEPKTTAGRVAPAGGEIGRKVPGLP